jgi:hypothetical protein
VVWLDITAAKARYGRWLGASIAAFVPFARTTRSRTKREAALAQQSQGPMEADDDLVIRLRRLR